MMSTMIKSIMVLIIAINIVYSSRFSKINKKFNGKKEFNGIYDAARYEEPIPMEYMEASNDETAQEIKDKLSLVEVDTDGNEYTYEFDVTEIDELLKTAKKLGKELSNGNSANKDIYHKEEKHNKQEEKNEVLEAKRRLVILGADTRTEITSTSSSPYKQIGLLEFTSGGSPYICSAALISSKVILTAGHCVHSGGANGAWYTGFKFYPGRSRLIGSVTGYYYTASRISSFSGWTSSSNYDYDIGFIELVVSPGIGWLGFGWDNSISTSYFLNLAGYPADKSYGSLWYTGDYVKVAYTETLLTDDSDTYGGHSGSSCWFYPAWNNYNLATLAIHSGSGTYSGVVHNRHTRITSAKYTSICTWIADPTLC